MTAKPHIENARGVGRPKKDARDAAVFIARRWRMDFLRESARDADEWIIGHWRDSTRNGEAVGIKDPAHVRAAVRRATQDTWLRRSYLLFNDALRITSDGVTVLDDSDPEHLAWQFPDKLRAGFEMDGCAIAALEALRDSAPNNQNQRGWVWMAGLTEARRIDSDRMEFYDETYTRTIGPHSRVTVDEFWDDAGPWTRPATTVIGAIAVLYGVLRFNRIHRLLPKQYLFGSRES